LLHPEIWDRAAALLHIVAMRRPNCEIDIGLEEEILGRKSDKSSQSYSAPMARPETSGSDQMAKIS
jgi:hypothetical protein